MPSLSTVWVSSLLLIWSCIIRQSVASPMQLHVRRDNRASLNAPSSVADSEIHPRFAGALFGGLATTVVGNALGGAISPMFAKVGEKLSMGKTQPEPIPEEDQTEVAPAKVPTTQAKASKAQLAAEETEDSSSVNQSSAEVPATQAKASKAQLAAEETEDSSSVNQSSAEETEKLNNSSKSSKSEKKEKLKELESEEED